jgi:hypothetical protein
MLLKPASANEVALDPATNMAATATIQLNFRIHSSCAERMER